jgi:predicted nucleic acid-binding protein
LYCLNGDAKRLPILDALLQQSLRGDLIIFTSTISIAEVAFVAAEILARKLDERQEQLIDRFWGDRNTIELVEFHRVIAVGARTLIRQAMLQRWKLRANDAMHLATAQILAVDEFHTYDGELFKFSPLTGYPIHEPKGDQLPLPVPMP